MSDTSGRVGPPDTGRESSESTVKTISVIGCGKVGKTLARLWTRHNVLDVRSVLNRSPASGAEAVEFVGSGRAIDRCDQMEPTDVVMISTPAESIEACCRRLCRTPVVREGVVLFHTSGSLPSTLLEPARARGASIASVHPVKSFAEPATAVETFAGTFCAIEGDPEACELLGDVFRRCGARTFPVDPGQKTTYHAATVIVCNYLVALMEVGLRCFERAGIPRETACEVTEPIVRGTVESLFELGPVRALTGPIARGEPSVVARQCQALGQWDESIQRIYKELGRVALSLAAIQGNADPEALAVIERALRT